MLIAAVCEIAGLATDRTRDPRLDPVRLAEQRWAPIRAQLAAAGTPVTVGYEGAVAGAVVFTNEEATERYYRAQFELVPSVLSLNQHRGWVILDRPGKLPQLIRR